MTLKEAIERAKCRKGKSDGISTSGAYWLACKPIKLLRCGGDGIGNSGPDITFELELRHYRDGQVKATVLRHAWHQNGSWGGAGDERELLSSSVMDCSNVEDVIVHLKSHRFGDYDYRERIYSDGNEDVITEALTALGLDVAEQSPDEGDSHE